MRCKEWINMMEITLMKKSRAFNLVVFACMLSFAFVATFYETVHAADNVFVKGARAWSELCWRSALL